MRGSQDRPFGTSEFHVLLAGPSSWQSRLGPVVEDMDDVSVTTVRTGAQVEGALGGATASHGKSSHGFGGIDCLVVAGTLEDTTGAELVHSPTVRAAGIPCLLAPDSVSDLESADEPGTATDMESGEDPGADADDSTRDGTVWTIPLEDGPGVTGVDGIETVLARERAAATARSDTATLEGAFRDPDRFVAVLSTDGTTRALNDTATEALGSGRDSLLGKRFWALPGLGRDDVRRRVQQAVRTAADGEYATFEADLAGAGSADPSGPESGASEPSDSAEAPATRYEFRVQPAGGSDSLLVQGSVRTDVERLEAELRASEELHRVTLNNMTDTVLVTNDEGEFTYVCPNVHFIFGYTAEEIYDLGTIDELLGTDLYDPDDLDAEGVLTNVECEATDKSGTDHTLLVNVRRVSIQDGSILYSCRDITTRKQREQALTQLQETSRKLLYAETDAEVATEIANDAATALTEGGVALYGFDEGQNVLYPMAVSDTLVQALGRLPDVRLDQDTCVSTAYVETETVTAGDSQNGPFSSLGDRIAVPLGTHGVLLVGTMESTPLEDVNEEVAELLAATAEAAFDRLARERDLRDRDERLQRQNRRLTEANRINEIIRDIDRAIVDAESRTEIEQAVCEHLSTNDRFAFAWIGEQTAHSRQVRPREWAGADGGYLDEISLSGSDDPVPEPAVRTAAERSMTVVPNVANQLHEADWCKAAVSRNFGSVLSVPLEYDGVLFGTLTVYDDEPESFSETVRSVFAELGQTIGAAINAVQRKEALQSDAVTRLTYRIDDTGSILSRLSRKHDCRLAVTSEVTRADDTSILFVTVSGVSPAVLVESATGLVDVVDGEVIRAGDEAAIDAGDEEGLVSLAVRGPFVTAVLANHGATRRRLESTPEGVELVVDVPDAATIRTVDELLSDRFDEVDLQSQTKQTRASARAEDDDSLLTPRQEEVAQVAYHSGYFDSDREISGRDIAETLDISHTAFYGHIRRVERKLFGAMFDHHGEYIPVE